MDHSSLTDRVEIVKGFILECRGNGNFLSRDEELIVLKWLQLSQDFKILLKALDKIIPEFYEKYTGRRYPPKINKIEKKVAQAVEQLLSLQS